MTLPKFGPVTGIYTESSVTDFVCGCGARTTLRTEAVRTTPPFR